MEVIRASEGITQPYVYFGSSMKMNYEAQKSEVGKYKAITAKRKFSEEVKKA